jgi:hypothetical protein
MYSSRLTIRLLVVSAFLIAANPPAAQSTSSSAFGPQYLEPLPTDTREFVPRLSFKLLTDIRLPGPLPERGPRLVGDRIEIPVAGSVALADWTSGTAPQLTPGDLPDAAAAADMPWAVSSDGQHRYRATPDGWMLAQKRCRSCKKGWRKKWRLRVPGSAEVPPLVTRKRLFFGGLENRVYCVKRRNGHRVWAKDVKSRIVDPLVMWNALPVLDPTADLPGDFQLILVVASKRSEIVALSAGSGERIASFTLSESEGKLVGVPVATPDGRIIVARQKYAASEASLMVLMLEPPEEAPEEPPPDAASDPLNPPEAADAELSATRSAPAPP